MQAAKVSANGTVSAGTAATQAAMACCRLSLAPDWPSAAAAGGNQRDQHEYGATKHEQRTPREPNVAARTCQRGIVAPPLARQICPVQ